MQALKAELEAKKASLEYTRSESRKLYVARRDIEKERVNSYLSAHEERQLVKKRCIPPQETVPCQPISSAEKKEALPHQASYSKAATIKINTIENSEENRFSTLLFEHQDTLSLDLKMNKEHGMTSHEKLLLEWEKAEIRQEPTNGQVLHPQLPHEHKPRAFPENQMALKGVETKMDQPESLHLKVISELQPVVRNKQFLSEIFTQTSQYLMPFFVLLQEQNIPDSVIEHLMEIVGFLQTKQYVKANDAYIRLSIGNAPWPIGVTMVCIHERSARERIHSNQVAHVLNDERQRKWIQSIKRLISFCQRAYPPARITQALG